MADHYRQAGSTGNFLTVKLRSSTTGNLVTGLTSASMTISAQRTGKATQESLGSLVAGTLGTFVSNSWVETQVAGEYQYCPPDASMVAGASSIDFKFSASGVVDAGEHVVLTGQFGSLPIQGGAIPNANAGSVTGLPTLDGLGNVQASLANASLQNFARLASGQQFHNVWFVDPSNGNDIFTGKTPISAVSDGPFATINKAISVAASGDLILLSGGTHTPTGACSIPDGVSVKGQGINVTFIDGHSLTISGNGCIVRPGSNARLSDLTILGDSTIGNFTAPIGYDCGSQNPPVNALVERVRTYGWSDGIYVKAKAGQTCSIRFRDSIFESGYDTLNAIPNSAADVGTINLELENCEFIGAGPAGRGDPVRCVCHEANGTIRMWGGRIDATSAGSGAVYGVVTVAQSGNTNAPVIRCYGVEIYTSGGSSHNDFANGIGTITETDCTYDPATISGTVTQRQPLAGIDLTNIRQATGATTLNNISLGGNVAGSVGSVSGDVAGKVLGGGTSTIVGVGTNANMVLANGQTFLLLPNGSSSGAGGTVAIFNKEEVTGYANYPFDQGFNGGVDLTGWGEMLFMVKARKQDADTAALVQVKVTNGGSASDGLLLLNGAAPVSPITAADGNFNTISVTGGTTPAFSFNIHLSAPAMAQLPDGGTFFWEWAWWKGGDKQAYQGTGIFKMGQTIIDSPTQP